MARQFDANLSSCNGDKDVFGSLALSSSCPQQRSRLWDEALEAETEGKGSLQTLSLQCYETLNSLYYYRYSGIKYACLRSQSTTTVAIRFRLLITYIDCKDTLFTGRGR